MKYKKTRYICKATLFLLLMVFSACSSKSSYNYKNKFKLIEPVENFGKHFSDSKIFIEFDISPKKINFNLKNRSDRPIEILWSDVKFSDTDGKDVPVSGRGTLFSEKMKKSLNPSPLTIPAGQTIMDSIVPVENVDQWKEWVWYIKPMFNLVDETAKEYKGKTLGLDLPIRIAGKVVNYHFTFLVYDVIQVNRISKG